MINAVAVRATSAVMVCILTSTIVDAIDRRTTPAE
jgi:hypothetical protein